MFQGKVLLDGIVMIVAIALLGTSLMAQTSPPDWRPEMPVHQGPLGAGWGWQPSLACGDGICVAVWRSLAGIMAIRLEPSGRVIDPVPFVVVAAENAYTARVAWNGRSFVVVWMQASRMSARIIEPDGDMPSLPRTISLQNSNSFSLRVAGGGGRTIAVSYGEAVLIESDGSMHELPLAPEAGYWFSNVASDGESFLLIGSQRAQPAGAVRLRWTVSDGFAEPVTGGPGASTVVGMSSGHAVLTANASELTITRTDSYGRTTGSDTLQLPAPIYGFTASASGDVIHVLSTSVANGQEGELMFTRIDGESRSTSTLLGVEGVAPSIASLGDDHGVVAWHHAGSVYGAPINLEQGLTAEPGALALARPEQRSPSVTATGSGWFVTWNERREQDELLRGRVFSPTLVPGPVVDVADTPETPVVAANDELILVTWFDTENLVGRRFGLDGSALDEQPFLLASQSMRWWIPQYADSHAVTWNGRHFLVAWTEAPNRSLRITRVTPEGIVLDPDGKGVATSGRSTNQVLPSFGAAGESTLLVWQDGEYNYDCQITCVFGPPAQIEAMILDLEGNPTQSSSMLLVDSAQSVSAPRIASAGGMHLLVWERDWEIMAQVLTSRGELYGRPFRIGTLGAGSVTLSAVGDRFIVVWQQMGKLFVQRIGSRGVQLETTVLADVLPRPLLWPDRSMLPAVASRGEDTLVAYSRISEPDGGSLQAFMRGTYTPAPRMRGVRRLARRTFPSVWHLHVPHASGDLSWRGRAQNVEAGTVVRDARRRSDPT